MESPPLQIVVAEVFFVVGGIGRVFVFICM